MYSLVTAQPPLMPLLPIVPPFPVGSAGSLALMICLTARTWTVLDPVLVNAGVLIAELRAVQLDGSAKPDINAVKMLPPGVDEHDVLRADEFTAGFLRAFIARRRIVHEAFLPSRTSTRRLAFSILGFFRNSARASSVSLITFVHRVPLSQWNL